MSDSKNFNAIKEEVLRNGGFYVHFYFDMHANDPSGLQNIMVGFISKLTKEQGVRLAVGEVDEPIKHQDMFSTTAHVNLLVSNFPDLSRLALTYAPIAIEVEEPLDAKISCGDIQTALMNASSIAQELTQHILTKGLTPAEKAVFEKQMAIRADLGRRLIEQSGEEEKKAQP